MSYRFLPAAITLALAACATAPIPEREPDESDADPMLADAGIAPRQAVGADVGGEVLAEPGEAGVEQR